MDPIKDIQYCSGREIRAVCLKRESPSNYPIPFARAGGKYIHEVSEIYWILFMRREHTAWNRKRWKLIINYHGISFVGNEWHYFYWRNKKSENDIKYKYINYDLLILNIIYGISWLSIVICQPVTRTAVESPSRHGWMCLLINLWSSSVMYADGNW